MAWRLAGRSNEMTSQILATILVALTTLSTLACDQADHLVAKRSVRNYNVSPIFYAWFPVHRCTVGRFLGRRISGTLIATVNVDSEGQCAFMLWLLSTGDMGSARFANYKESENVCEIVDMKSSSVRTMDKSWREVMWSKCKPIRRTTTRTPETTPTTPRLTSARPWPDSMTTLEPAKPWGGDSTTLEAGQHWPEPRTTPEPQPKPITTPATPEGATTQDPTVNPFPGRCGRSSFPQAIQSSRGNFQRIVGGVEATPHSIPFIVSLRPYAFGSHNCAGSVIRVNEKDESDIVVTAAHCVEYDENSEVVAGAHYGSKKMPGEQSRSVEKVAIHPKYKAGALWPNDIAVLKLRQPIKFSKTIQPVCLPAQNEVVEDGTVGFVAGWGRLAYGDRLPDELREVAVPVMKHEDCVKAYNTSIDNSIMLCAGYEAGQKDACKGDSGGPFFVQGTGGYTLQGLVSFSRGCARPRTPHVYVRVATFVDWIQQQAKALTSL